MSALAAQGASEIDRIGVIVPAHNEAETLPRCLAALSVAAHATTLPVTIIVVLDTCTDGSARAVDVARTLDGGLIEAMAVEVRNVGAARRAGIADYLRRHGSVGTWLATTDADSEVPSNWLTAQVKHAHAGARMVAGTVDVGDWVDYSGAVRERMSRDYAAGPHRHIHGANLSFSAEAYCAHGGFPAVPCHEDVALVDAFRAGNEPIAWAMDLPVVTSARRIGRAPNGFANYLAKLERSVKNSAGASHVG